MKLKRHKSSKKNLKGNRKMKTIKFNDFLNEQLSDNSFNEGYQAEKAILESAVAVANARSKAGLTQRQLSELSMFLNQLSLVLKEDITLALKL